MGRARYKKSSKGRRGDLDCDNSSNGQHNADEDESSYASCSAIRFTGFCIVLVMVMAVRHLLGYEEQQRLGHEEQQRHNYKNGSHAIVEQESEQQPLRKLAFRYRHRVCNDSSIWSAFNESLISLVRKRRYEPQVMTELLSLIKEPLDRYYSGKGQSVRHGKPYQTCAVVGNSGILLKKSFGSLIDQHDMVIRVNYAKTEGYEKWVGSKTTLAFINSNVFYKCLSKSSCPCRNSEHVPTLMYICQVRHWMDFANCNPVRLSPVLFTDPRLDNLCMRIALHYSLHGFSSDSFDLWDQAHEQLYFHYSSGMQAVMVALGICEKVDLFGFGKALDAKHHYHSNQKNELQIHDYPAEEMLYSDLESGQAMLVPYLNQSKLRVPPLEIFN